MEYNFIQISFNVEQVASASHAVAHTIGPIFKLDNTPCSFSKKNGQLCLWTKIRTKQWLVLGNFAIFPSVV